MTKRGMTLILLTAALLTLLIFAPALADTEGDYDYTVLPDGSAKITGYHGGGGDIVLPDTLGGRPVTVVGGIIDMSAGVTEDVFEYNRALTSVVIPEGVTRVGAYAFKDCSNITSLMLPQSLESVDAFAFSWCSSLTELTIPKNVTFIGESAFNGLFSLETLIIEAENPVLTQNPFTYCTALKSISATGGALTVMDGALVRTDDMTLILPPYGLGSLTVPQGVRRVGDMAFFGCSAITDMTLPEGVTDIGFAALAYCDHMTDFAAPEGLYAIGAGAFTGCEALERAYLPASVTSVGNEAFEGCSASLVIITESESVLSYARDKGIATAN